MDDNYKPGFRWTPGAKKDIFRGEKWCGKCEQTKPLSEFQAASRASTKTKFFRSRCRGCQLQQQRQDRIDNPERGKQHNRDYYRKNRDKRLAYASYYSKTEEGKQKQKIREDEQYRQTLEAVFAEILEQDCCDVCNKPGTKTYWKRIHSRRKVDFVVLHRECKQDAVDEGLIPSIRCKLYEKEKIADG